MTPQIIFVVLLILFTTRGPVVMHVAAPDQDTCDHMAASAPDTFVGKKVPVAQGSDGTVLTLVLDAQAFCHAVTQQDHA